MSIEKKQSIKPLIKPHNIIIIRLIYKDISQIIKISEECNLESWSESDYQLEVYRENSFVFGAKYNDVLVGFIVARFGLHISPSIPTEVDLINIAVRNTYLKKGIGTLLLNELINEAQNLSAVHIWLEVRKSNFAARSFYTKKRFVEVQERKNFYTNPVEDAVIMKLDL